MPPKANKISKTCPVCNRDFLVLPSRQKKRFCTYECSVVASRGVKHWWVTKTVFKVGHQYFGNEESAKKRSIALSGRKIKQTKKRKRYIHSCWTRSYKKWRDSVFKKDEYQCQECGNTGGTLNAHHIQEWSLFPKRRFIVSNGVTLCVDCHKYVHWVVRLNDKIAKKYEEKPREA